MKLEGCLSFETLADVYFHSYFRAHFTAFTHQRFSHTLQCFGSLAWIWTFEKRSFQEKRKLLFFSPRGRGILPDFSHDWHMRRAPLGRIWPCLLGVAGLGSSGLLFTNRSPPFPYTHARLHGHMHRCDSTHTSMGICLFTFACVHMLYDLLWLLMLLLSIFFLFPQKKRQRVQKQYKSLGVDLNIKKSGYLFIRWTTDFQFCSLEIDSIFNLYFHCYTTK